MTAEEQKAFNNGFVMGRTSDGLITGVDQPPPPPQTSNKVMAIFMSNLYLWYTKNPDKNDICIATIPSWVKGSNGSSDSISFGSLTKVITFKGKLYTVSSYGAIISSENGSVWVYVGYCPNISTTLLLVCGDRVLAYGRTDVAPCYTFDFVTWTNTNKIPYASTINMLYGAYNAGVAVVGGQNGLAFRTNDFVNWVQVPGSSVMSAGTVLYGDRFVIPKFTSYGVGDTLTTSANGITWSSAKTNMISINKMVYFEGKYFAIGYDLNYKYGVFMTTNLITWTTIYAMSTTPYFNNFGIVNNNLYMWITTTMYRLNKTTLTFNEIYKTANIEQAIMLQCEL